MATLAQELHETSHCSPLLRRAKLLGFATTEDFVRLAVARGCYHYGPGFPACQNDPGIDAISNEELVGLLLLGSNEFDSFAVRCAAQLISVCDAEDLAFLARRERVARPLAYIAQAAVKYDTSNTEFWRNLLNLLGEQARVPDGVMPHWSRFVSQTGVTRGGQGKITWLKCL